MIGAPNPSVLESRVLRLLRIWGITPLGCEVVAAGGSYRLDFLILPGLALEVDGFAYHSSPAAKSADSIRRNRLQLAGYVVLQSDWVEVYRHPERLRAALLDAIRWAEDGSRPSGYAG